VKRIHSDQEPGHILNVADPRHCKPFATVFFIDFFVIFPEFFFCDKDGTVCCVGERPRGDGSVPLPGREPGELPL